MEEQVKGLIIDVADLQKTLGSAYSLLEDLTNDVIEMRKEIDEIKRSNKVVTAISSEKQTENEIMKAFGI